MHFNLSKARNAAGNVNYRLTFYVRRSHERRAKRRREWFASKKLANARIDELNRIERANGIDGVANEVLGECLLPLSSDTVSEAAGKFIAVKESSGRAFSTTYEMKMKLRVLASNFLGVKIGEVQPAEIQIALNKIGGSKQNRLNHFRVWRNFFNWCWRNRLLHESPMRGVEPPSVERKLPVFAPAERIAALVEAARTDSARNGGFRATGAGALLPYVLLTFFSGVRPEEATRLRRDWGDFNFDRGEIVLNEGVTKISRVRIVRLAPALTEVFRVLRARGFRPGFFSRRVFDRVRKAAGLDGEGWAADIGRHSYASYSFALGVSEAELVMDMGNSVGVLRSHYINRLATREEAERWRMVLLGLLVDLATCGDR